MVAAVVVVAGIVMVVAVEAVVEVAGCGMADEVVSEPDPHAAATVAVTRTAAARRSERDGGRIRLINLTLSSSGPVPGAHSPGPAERRSASFTGADRKRIEFDEC